MFRVLRFSAVVTLISAACFAQTTNGSVAPPAAAPAQSASPAKAGDAVASPVAVNANAPATAAPNPLEEGLSLYRRGSFDAAIAQYQEFLQRFPKSADAYAGLVRIALKQKKVEQAAETIEKGLALNDAPRMHVARGEVWFRQGKISEAENEWTGVINRGFPDARAYLGLARVRNAVAMYKDSKRLIGKAHELDATDPEIYERWIVTLPREERIKNLQETLAGANDWAPDERAALTRYLEALKDRTKQKNSTCHLVTKITAAETQLVRIAIDPEHLRGYGLSVALNGHKSPLLLDTGASGILVSRSVAEQAGISKITEEKILGIGDQGSRNAYVGIADSIKIGELEFQNCQVNVMESRSVAGEYGLIGTDVFQDFLVDLDFPDEKLKLSQLPQRPGEADQKLALKSEEDADDDSSEPPTGDDSKNDLKPDAKSQSGSAASDAGTKAALSAAPPSGPQDRYIAPEMKSYTRVFRFGHELLVPTAIGDVPNKLFMMDTGAVMNSISPAAAREVTKVSNSDKQVKGISGRVENVYAASKAVLRFGDIRQENQEMTAFDNTSLSDHAGVEISGFLGFILLRFLEIKIDYRDALVDFSFDPKRFGQ
jgi:tetratricopeptide (TPR) repeat protein